MLSAIAAIVVAGSAVGAPLGPNVVLVLVDDMGWQDTSLAFGLKEKVVGRHFRTPNLERLARRGVRVDQAYSSCTVCTPTRAALLTGVHPARSRITSWVHSGQDTDGGHPDLLTPDWNKKGLQPGQSQTLAELFKAAGYRTVQIGKAHFGAAGTPGADPRNLGFDQTIGGSAAGHPSSFYGLESFAAKKANPGDPPKHNDVPHLDKYHGKDIYLDEALAAEAAGVVAEAAKAKQPLFLWFSPYGVHTPLQANKRLLPKYRGMDEREAAYATMVETIDHALGTLLAALEKAGQLDETILLFTSDNGGLSQTARGGFPNLHNLPLRSGKGSGYEGGTRVPFVAAGPGIAKGVALTRTYLASADLYATVADLAGVAAPPKDGRSLAASLRSGREAPNLGPLIWHYPHHRGFAGPGLEPYSAIRMGDFKAIYFYGQRRWELYNLTADLGETRDVSRNRADKLSELGKALLEGLHEMGAQFPLDKATNRPVVPESPYGGVKSP